MAWTAGRSSSRIGSIRSLTGGRATMSPPRPSARDAARQRHVLGHEAREVVGVARRRGAGRPERQRAPRRARRVPPSPRATRLGRAPGLEVHGDQPTRPSSSGSRAGREQGRRRRRRGRGPGPTARPAGAGRRDRRDPPTRAAADSSAAGGRDADDRQAAGRARAPSPSRCPPAGRERAGPRPDDDRRRSATVDAAIAEQALERAGGASRRGGSRPPSSSPPSGSPASGRARRRPGRGGVDGEQRPRRRSTAHPAASR